MHYYTLRAPLPAQVVVLGGGHNGLADLLRSAARE